MRRAISIAICLLFLASGLIRIGAGGVMMGQEAGWWALGGEVAEALVDTRAFFAEVDVNMVGFTPFTYFAYIVLMGVSIALGALGQLARRRWGLALIGLYLASHAFLFANFMTVNPKVYFLIAGIVLTLVLVWANRRPAMARFG